MVDVDDYHRQGLEAFQADNFTGAIAKMEQAVALNGSRADIRANLGVILHRAGELDRAEEQFRASLVINPDDPTVYYNFGLMLGDSGRLGEALSQYDKSISLDAGNAAAHNNRGNLLKKLKRVEEAIVAYNRAIEADPNFAPAYRNFADAEEALGDVQGAQKNYARAIGLRGDVGSRIRDALLLPIIPESKDQILEYRNRLENRLDKLLDDDLIFEDPLSQVGATNFALAYHGLDDKAIQEKIARFYRQACPSLTYVSPHCESSPSLAREKIKIGFVSSFLYEHTIGKLMHQLIEGLPRSRFEVQVLSFSNIHDQWSEKLTQAAGSFICLPNSLSVARETIAAAELDILYYADIGIEPMTYFLSFSRLAPVQCVTWGHPVTTGVDTLDYFISSDLTEPEGAENFYSEKLIKLESIPSLVAPPDFNGETSPDMRGNSPLVVCPQSLFKYHPEFDAILRLILRDNKNAEFRLIAGNFDAWTNLLQKRFARTMGELADRIIFQPRLDREQYAKLIQTADIILDTPHFCGGMTTFEALAADTPVVTLPGDFMRGRVSLGLYKQMNVLDCVAADAEDYVGIVGELCSNEVNRIDLREKIHGTKNKIFNDQGVIGSQIKFFEQALADI